MERRPRGKHTQEKRQERQIINMQTRRTIREAGKRKKKHITCSYHNSQFSKVYQYFRDLG